LVVVAVEERDVSIPTPYIEAARRASVAGAMVGCFPQDFRPASDLARRLAALASPAGDPSRNEEVVVWNGLLVAPNSGRWYPIVDGIPGVLPDSLRDWSRDQDILRRNPGLPAEIREALAKAVTIADRNVKPGDNHKSSEITLLDKVDDVGSFLEPGLYSPFNPGDFFHSSAMIRGFSVYIPFLHLDQGSYVLDSGSGYSWTPGRRNGS
jgi:uncharacterized protein YbaR (Trm112 family)